MSHKSVRLSVGVMIHACVCVCMCTERTSTNGQDGVLESS